MARTKKQKRAKIRIRNIGYAGVYGSGSGGVVYSPGARRALTTAKPGSKIRLNNSMVVTGPSRTRRGMPSAYYRQYNKLEKRYKSGSKYIRKVHLSGAGVRVRINGQKYIAASSLRNQQALAWTNRRGTVVNAIYSRPVGTYGIRGGAKVTSLGFVSERGEYKQKPASQRPERRNTGRPSGPRDRRAAARKAVRRRRRDSRGRLR
jgi:hypothetical protein